MGLTSAPRIVKGPGADKLVGTPTTDAGGAYSLKKRAKHGKHFAIVGPVTITDVAACLGADSPPVRA